MPVEIKELVIRAVVQHGHTSAGGCAAAEAPEGRAAAAVTGEEQANLVNAAVREVLRILKTAKER